MPREPVFLNMRSRTAVLCMTTALLAAQRGFCVFGHSGRQPLAERRWAVVGVADVLLRRRWQPLVRECDHLRPHDLGQLHLPCYQQPRAVRGAGGHDDAGADRSMFPRRRGMRRGNPATPAMLNVHANHSGSLPGASRPESRAGLRTAGHDDRFEHGTTLSAAISFAQLTYLSDNITS